MIFLALLALQQQTMREFVFTASNPVHSVFVAGTFNGWNKGATPMKLDADGKTWRVRVPVEPGRIEYKFVLDGENWITDPANPKTADDGNGHTNSLLLIFPPGYDAPARQGDGTITITALKHQQLPSFLNLDRGQLSVSLRARPGDIASVSVLANGRAIPMTSEPMDDFYSRYQTQVPWDGKSKIAYQFALKDGAQTKYFGPSGLTNSPDGNQYVLDPRTFRPIAPPVWLEKTVIYQIFPDRFANGDKRNDPADVVAWGGKPTFYNFFGGDVAGIHQHLGYLKDLGIKAVYFNPIFASRSNHRYETIDYLRVDPRFGTNEEFESLTHDMKKAGIGTILDGVFNHTATDFAPFADILKNQQSSKYLDWYTVKSFPVKVQENPPYVAWFNFPSLPKLNVLNPETTTYLLDSVSFWMKHADIAGWRLDAANEVPMKFWQAFRKRVKSLDPNAWIVGEEWGDASAWLGGDQWDASMNYPFREAVLKFVSTTGNGKASDLLTNLMHVYRMYAPQVSRNQMNVLSTHDTQRILTLCGGNKGLAKLAAVIQMTWVGVPNVYYGDELGMEGGADPDDRRTLLWEQANGGNDMLSLYRKLIAVRESNPELQSGDPVVLTSDDQNQTAAYARVLGGRAVIVAVNRASEPRFIDIPVTGRIPISSESLRQGFTNALGGNVVRIGSQGHIRVELPAEGAAILLPPKRALTSSRRATESSRHSHPRLHSLA